MRTVALVGVVLLASMAFGASAEAPSDPSESVRFVFAWLPGLEAVATSTRTRTRSRDAAEPTGMSMTVSYDVSVEPEGENEFMLKLLVGAMVSEATSGLPADQVLATEIPEDVSMTSLMTVVTEPDGLVPHAYTMTKIVSGTETRNGQPQFVEQRDTLEVRYSYD